MKVKSFSNASHEILDEEINRFIKGKKIINFNFSTVKIGYCSISDETYYNFTCMISYEEK